MAFLSPLPPPPENERQLFERAQALAGASFGELAARAQLPIPKDLKRDKGWVGMLLELYLGAMAGSKPEQDFPELGIELKTIPVDAAGKPLETTFVCVAPLTGNSGVTGQQPRSPQVGARLVDTGRRRTADPAGRTPRRLAAAVEPERRRRRESTPRLGRVDGSDRTRPRRAHHRAPRRSVAAAPQSRQQQGAHRSHRRTGATYHDAAARFLPEKSFTGALLARHFSI